MNKTQNAFIESFRHRRVEKEIAKLKTETEQFTQSDHGSVTPGSLASDCGTPGEVYFATNPCPPDTEPCGDSGQYSVVIDDWNREVSADGWGIATSGGTWDTIPGEDDPLTWFVDSERGNLIGLETGESWLRLPVPQDPRYRYSILDIRTKFRCESEDAALAVWNTTGSLGMGWILNIDPADAGANKGLFLVRYPNAGTNQLIRVYSYEQLDAMGVIDATGDIWIVLRINWTTKRFYLKIWVDGNVEPEEFAGVSSDTVDAHIARLEVNSGGSAGATTFNIVTFDSYWSVGSCASQVIDDFNRVVAPDSWGATSGGAGLWNLAGSAIASVDGSAGKLTLTNDIGHVCQLTTSAGAPWNKPNYTIEARIKFETMPVVGSYSATPFLDFAMETLGTGSQTTVRVTISPDLATSKIESGGASALLDPVMWAANTWYHVKAQVVGGIPRAKVWADSDDEPDWQVQGTSTIPITGTFRFDIGWVDGNEQSQVFYVDDLAISCTPCSAICTSCGGAEEESWTNESNWTVTVDSPAETVTFPGGTVEFEFTRGGAGLGFADIFLPIDCASKLATVTGTFYIEDGSTIEYGFSTATVAPLGPQTLTFSWAIGTAGELDGQTFVYVDQVDGNNSPTNNPDYVVPGTLGLSGSTTVKVRIETFGDPTFPTGRYRIWGGGIPEPEDWPFGGIAFSELPNYVYIQFVGNPPSPNPGSSTAVSVSSIGVTDSSVPCVQDSGLNAGGGDGLIGWGGDNIVTYPDQILTGEDQPAGWSRYERGYPGAETNGAGGSFPIYRANNAFGGKLINTFEQMLDRFFNDPEPAPYHSGAFVVKKGVDPAIPATYFMKFTIIDWGQINLYHYGLVAPGFSLCLNAAPSLALSGGSDVVAFNFPFYWQGGGSFYGNGTRGGLTVGSQGPSPAFYDSMDVAWNTNTQYSLRLERTSSLIRAKLWNTNNETEPVNFQIEGSSQPAYPSGLSLRLDPAHHNLGGRVQPIFISFDLIEVNGVNIGAEEDCDSVSNSEGDSLSGIPGELEDLDAFLDSLGGDSSTLTQDTTVTATLSRQTESRYFLPSDGSQIINLWINGVHGEPGIHYNFTKPRLVEMTHTYPVGTEITAQYVAVGGTS